MPWLFSALAGSMIALPYFISLWGSSWLFSWFGLSILYRYQKSLSSYQSPYVFGFFCYLLCSLFWLVPVAVQFGTLPWLLACVCLFAFLGLIVWLHIGSFKLLKSLTPRFNALIFVGVWLITEVIMYFSHIPLLSLAATQAYSPLVTLNAVTGTLGFALIMLLIVTRSFFQQGILLFFIILFASLIPKYYDKIPDSHIQAAVIQPDHNSNFIELYHQANQDDVSIWPEGLLPTSVNDIIDKDEDNKHVMIFGSLYKDNSGIHNVMVKDAGNDQQMVQKKYLVPFGESIFIDSLPETIQSYINQIKNTYWPEISWLSHHPIKSNNTMSLSIGAIHAFICYDALFADPDGQHSAGINIIINNNQWYALSMTKRWLFARYRLIAYASLKDTLISSFDGYSGVIKPLTNEILTTSNHLESVVHDEVSLYNVNTIWSYGIDVILRYVIIILFAGTIICTVST